MINKILTAPIPFEEAWSDAKAQAAGVILIRMVVEAVRGAPGTADDFVAGLLASRYAPLGLTAPPVEKPWCSAGAVEPAADAALAAEMKRGVAHLEPLFAQLPVGVREVVLENWSAWRVVGCLLGAWCDRKDCGDENECRSRSNPFPRFIAQSLGNPAPVQLRSLPGILWERLRSSLSLALALAATRAWEVGSKKIIPTNQQSLKVKRDHKLSLGMNIAIDLVASGSASSDATGAVGGGRRHSRP